MLNKETRGFHGQRWSRACDQLQGQAYVLVTLLGARGSTPRASGTKMVITPEHIFDTIGGGHLEFAVIQKARELLANNDHGQHLQHMPLGAKLGQCCGGSTSVLFEVMAGQSLNLDVYGAGHVAHALIGILSALPINVRWIDSRAELFPEELPVNVTAVVAEDPDYEVAHAEAGSAYLVLTHNHQLDYRLTEAILKRGDALWFGLIGSDTKAKRFRMRLQHHQFSDAQIATVCCPVGLDAVPGKEPMEVAVSIAGQLIALYQSHRQPEPSKQSLTWKQLRELMQPMPSPSSDIFTEEPSL